MSKVYDKTWKKIVLALVAVMLIGGAFGGGTETAPKDKAETVASEPQNKAPERSEECVRVKPSMQKHLLQNAPQRLEPVGQAWAVRSDDYEEVYMIATEFKVDGETLTGVWGSNDLRRGYGITVAVDGFATEFTDWPNELADGGFSIADDGAEEAVTCLEG